MNIKTKIKQILSRISREYCYDEMSRSGHALMLFCEGKGVDDGDGGMKCVPLRCTKCPRYFEGFDAESYRRFIMRQRVPNIRKVYEMGLLKNCEKCYFNNMCLVKDSDNCPLDNPMTYSSNLKRD